MNHEQEILSVLAQYIKDHDGDPSKIAPEATLSDLGIDSMDVLDLGFWFEDHFKINISPEDFRVNTVAEAVAALNALLQEVDAATKSPG